SMQRPPVVNAITRLADSEAFAISLSERIVKSSSCLRWMRWRSWRNLLNFGRHRVHFLRAPRLNINHVDHADDLGRAAERTGHGRGLTVTRIAGGYTRHGLVGRGVGATMELITMEGADTPSTFRSAVSNGINTRHPDPVRSRTVPSRRARRSRG